MATQKKVTSKKTTGMKSQPSRVATAKKSNAKAPAKAKAKGKSSPAPKPKKATPAPKSKKAAPVAKTKVPVKAISKPVAKKQAPKKQTFASHKPKVAPKAKPAAAKGKPVGKTSSKTIVSKPVSQAKANPKIVSKPVTKPVVKLAKPAPKPLAKPAPKPLAKPTPKPLAKPVATKNKTSPVVKAPQKVQAKLVPKTQVVQEKKVSPAPVKQVVKQKAAESAPKPTVPDTKALAIKSKTISKHTGSNISDVATKPSVSSKVSAPKARDTRQVKESQIKSSKPFTVHTPKPIDKMSDRKENKPAVAAAYEEPQKTRYSDKELEEFDQLIDQKLIVAREQLEFYLKQLEDMAENPDNKIKGLDDGLSSLESERISSMASRQQKLIQHLENAKIRIKNKVYGICRETGRLISKERLRAVPHATLSIEAKQAQN